MSFKYRVGTKIVSQERVFFIFECYYEDDMPSSYFQCIDDDEFPNPLSRWDNYEDLKETYVLMSAAFDKPVIDLDNFPNIYQE